MSDESAKHIDLATSDKNTDRIDLGMTASGQPLIKRVTADKGMQPTLSAAPTPPPPAPTDAASSARPPKASDK